MAYMTSKNVIIFDDSIPTVAIIGRIMNWKGHDVFIKAASIVKTKAVFFIIGDCFWENEQYLKDLKELCRTLNVENKVVFTGNISNIYEVIHALDIVVNSSKNPEPFGLTIIEAMAAKKAVIISDIGAATEFIVSDENGLVFKAGDSEALAGKIEMLLANPIKRLSIGQEAYSLVKREFDMKNISKEIGSCILEAAQ